MTKQQFGLALTTMTQWWAPVKMRVSGDESIRGQLKKTEDGRLESDFPERMILLANHQVHAHKPEGKGMQALTVNRFIPTGYTSGGPPTLRGCTATFTLS